MKRSDEDLPIGNDAKKLKIEKGEETEIVQTIVEAPMVEAPTEEAPMVEAPTEEAPTEEAPMVEAPTYEASAEGAPIEEDPATVILGGSTQNVITQMMDIAEPMANLRTMLEQRLQCNLIEHEIYLQNSAQLDPAKSLLEQGVSAEGVVQFSVQVISTQGVKPRLNIVDIVKPIIETVEVPVETVEHDLIAAGDASAKLQAEEQVEEVTRWVVCNNYRDEQEKFNIPFDPMEWEPHHTVHWLRWAATEFSLPIEVSVLNTMKMSGRVLCVLTKDDFVSRLPKPAGDLFWTHLDLLRKTVSEQESTIAEVKTSVPEVAESQTVTLGETPTIVIQTIKGPTTLPTLAAHRSVPRPPRSPRITKCSSDDKVSPGNRTGNNGQIQLWQFLLELLTDKDSQDCISWVGENGEFKLNDPELTAQRWGARKNKPSMNYEKLSRALRYYYDGDMIAKVHGKRFVYKFVCDLQGLLGYNATELNKLVTDCRQKKIDRLRGGHISQVTILK